MSDMAVAISVANGSGATLVISVAGIISSNMIPCIKYISPALLFNKSFLKSYQFILSILFLIQSLWLYVDIILNKFLNSLYCIC